MGSRGRMGRWEVKEALEIEILRGFTFGRFLLKFGKDKAGNHVTM
jgi:hypothetical protein